MKRILSSLAFLALVSHHAVAQLYLDLVPFRDGNRYGYCTTGGEMRVQPEYDEVSLYVPRYDSLYNPALRVVKNGKFMWISPTGQTVVPAGLKEVKERYYAGFLFYEVSDEQGLTGLYFNGKNTVPVRYRSLKWSPDPANDRILRILAFDGKTNTNFELKLEAPAGTDPGPGQRRSGFSGAGMFTAADAAQLKTRFALDSIRVVDTGIAYVEKGGQPGVLIRDRQFPLKKDYDVISIDLLDKHLGDCPGATSGKALITVQKGDLLMLMDEEGRNYFGDQWFTDTEGNLEYVVVKDGTRIGFFSKNICYKPIPTRYGRFVDPVWIQTGPGQRFLVYRVMHGKEEVLLGQNGVEYFRNVD